MLERAQTRSSGWLLLCGALLAVVTAGVLAEWSWLVSLDDRGQELTSRARGTEWLTDLLRSSELVLNVWALSIVTAITSAAMWAKGHLRAALFVLLTVLSSVAATAVYKVAMSRERPAIQIGEALTATSFPSGHASLAATLAGVGIVLVMMLVRRAGLRRILYLTFVTLALVVMAQRILLGRHFLTDVIGGSALGALIVFAALLIYSPIPRSHAAKSDPLPDAVPSARRLAVILNPIKVEDVGLFQDTVESMAVETGWSEPTWHQTTAEDSGTGQAEVVLAEGADLVVVCGGDGTVREVCAALAGTGIPVGIIPAGTGNLLARNLDLPLYIRAAIDIALTGQDRAIDMVEVSGDGIEDSNFMVMAGMGFDAAIMEGVNDRIKEKVGWLAYVLSGLKALMYPATKVDICIDDGEPTTHRARTIVVGNVGYLQAGMPLLPNATIDDGVIDVVLLHPRRFLSWIPLALRILTKGRRIDETMNRLTGRKVSIVAHTDVPRQLDGDSIGTGRELHMECVHGRALVRVPR